MSQLRIPLKYLANLLTAGDEAPVKLALERMLAGDVADLAAVRAHLDGARGGGT